MKKADIKPGVVYAYQRSKYDSPRPIVFLNAPADGVLYRERDYPKSGTPAFIKASPAAKPRRALGFGRGGIGYPAAHLSHDSRMTHQDLLGITLADFERATSGYHEGYEFDVITTLTHVTGPWDEVIAAHEAQKRAERESREQEQHEASESRARAIDILTALRARAGIEPDRIPTYGAVKSISIPLAEAEKLVALLAGRENDATAAVQGAAGEDQE